MNRKCDLSIESSRSNNMRLNYLRSIVGVDLNMDIAGVATWLNLCYVDWQLVGGSAVTAERPFIHPSIFNKNDIKLQLF